jgi:hypothetical protein
MLSHTGGLCCLWPALCPVSLYVMALFFFRCSHNEITRGLQVIKKEYEVKPLQKRPKSKIITSCIYCRYHESNMGLSCFAKSTKLRTNHYTIPTVDISASFAENGGSPDWVCSVQLSQMIKTNLFVSLALSNRCLFFLHPSGPKADLALSLPSWQQLQEGFKSIRTG